MLQKQTCKQNPRRYEGFLAGCLKFGKGLQNRQLGKSPPAQKPWAQLHWTSPFPNLQGFCFPLCTRAQREI